MCWGLFFPQQKYCVIQVRGYWPKKQVLTILFSLHWLLGALWVQLLYTIQTFAMKTELFMNFVIMFLTAGPDVSILQHL